MLTYKPSIRQKITLGYYAIVAILIAISVFTFLELDFMERKIMSGESVSEFFDTSLEIRRFEKNFFLYAKMKDFEENRLYVNRARELLDTRSRAFMAVTSAQSVDGLKEDLSEYQRFMDRYAKKIVTGSNDDARVQLEGRIRKTGKSIVTKAEEMSKTERKNLQAMLSSSRSVLIVSIVVLAVLVIVIGQILARMVVRPLKLLESSMEIIAEGGFERIHLHSRDREIVSLANAFNKMLKELELRQRHLVQSEKLASLGTLLSGVAHELNNPLSNISSSNQILMEEIVDGDLEHKRELVQQINEQTDRARNIVRSLLEFSRENDFVKESLPLKLLLEDTIRFVRGQVPTRVSIALNVPSDMSIRADKQRIQQVFLNLIKNSVEAVADEGSLSISAGKQAGISLSDDERARIYNYLKHKGKCSIEDDAVDIVFRDTGPGIPPDVLPRIFDPFFTTKDVGKGSGLGLSIVHEIIEEHDGCIAVDSEPGKGTTFLIRLPAK